MATSTAHVQRPAAQDGTGTPNHLLIWLDRYIGVPNDYLLLKRAFFMTTDPTTGYEVSLTEMDIDHSIRTREAIFVHLEGIQFMLRAFNTVDDCFEAIENNLDKRIFFITSGTKGRIIVPALVAYFRDKFTDVRPMYIFCGNMNMITVGDVTPAHSWALDYVDHLLMFNHQNDLLERMVLDIAEYFFTEAGRLHQAEQFEQARQHYHWAKRMLDRHERMTERVIMAARRQEIERCLTDLEQRLAQEHNETGDRPSEPCA